MASIAAWIDGAAARWSGAAYLEDAHGPRTVTYAGLRRCTQAWQRRLDDAGVPPGARVGVRLADPLGYATALVSHQGLYASSYVQEWLTSKLEPLGSSCSAWSVAAITWRLRSTSVSSTATSVRPGLPPNPGGA